MFNLILIKVARETAVRPVEEHNHTNVALPSELNTRISAIDFGGTASDAEIGEGGSQTIHSVSFCK